MVKSEVGDPAATVDQLLERVQASVVIENGEAAISHIRAVFSRKAQVITANEGLKRRNSSAGTWLLRLAGGSQQEA